MKFKFDAKLECRFDAINAVVDLFEGSPSTDGQTRIDLDSHECMGVQQWIGRGEIPSQDAVLANLQKILKGNGYLDFSIERGIEETLDTHERVKFFCKLPDCFKIPTPVGNNNPDWAVVKEDDAKLYLVKETKSTHTRHERRGTENPKVDCGKAHFEVLGVEFGVATTIHEVLEGGD